jgi:hypothetical protein
MQHPREFAFLRSTLLSFVALPFVALPIVALSTAACSGGDSKNIADAGIPDAVPAPDATSIAPTLFTPRTDLSDSELADQALALMGLGSTPAANNCEDCHGLTRQRMRYWQAITDVSITSCYADLNLETQAAAKAAIDCMRKVPGDDSSMYHPENVGIFSTGAHLPWFDFAFRRAFGEGYQTEYDNFLAMAGMPRGNQPPFTQDQFDIIATWFTRGVPEVDAKIPNEGVPTECLPGVTAAVGAHVADMKINGWQAINEQNSLLMVGCAGAATTLECLSAYPSYAEASVSSGWSNSVAGQQIRILRESGYSSSFWTRSSADGRFVGNGAQSGGANSRVVDLQRDVSIPGSGFYDPAFLPDNTGFMFHENGAYLCDQNLLVSEPTEINYSSDPDCSATQNVGLYQHLGAGVEGNDYWAVAGPFANDNGGHNVTRRDPETDFSNGSAIDLTPIIHNGTNYVDKPTQTFSTPLQGDAVLSTSSQMVISRQRGPSQRQLGYVMRKINSTPVGDGYQIELEEVARYCINGGKPAFSYDDRWMVLHHYIGNSDAQELGFTDASDPGFSGYANQAGSNIYLVDTLTGESTRITHMEPGQYALYPHFRSDGWIYFMVRTLGQGSEHIVASDAALRLQAAEL